MEFVIKKDVDKQDVKIELELIAENDSIALVGIDDKKTRKIVLVLGDGMFRRVTNAQLDGVHTDSIGRIEEYE